MQTSNNSNVLGIQKSLIWGEAESATSFPVPKSEKMKTMSGLSASLCPVTECRRLPVATGNVLEKALKKRAKQPDFFYFFASISVCVCVFFPPCRWVVQPVQTGTVSEETQAGHLTMGHPVVPLPQLLLLFFIYFNTHHFFKSCCRWDNFTMMRCYNVWRKYFVSIEKINNGGEFLMYDEHTLICCLSNLDFNELSVSFWRLMYYFHFEFWCQKKETTSLVSWPPARLLLWVTAESLQTSWALGVWRYRLCTQTD